MTLRRKNIFSKYLYSEEVSSEELFSDGHWITFRGKPMFIGGAQRKRRPKKPTGSVGKKVPLKGKDGKLLLDKDGKPKMKYEYKDSWKKKQNKFKFAVMASMAKNVDRMDRMLKYETERKKLDRKKAVATATRIMLLTGMRVGGGKGAMPGETKGKATFGTTTLQRRHVKIKGDEVTLDFRIGKAGQPFSVSFKDKAVADSLKRFMGDKDSAAPDDETPLFTYKDGRKTDVVTRRDIDKRMKKFDPDYKPKDLRTLKAHDTASEAAIEIIDRPRPILRTKKDIKAYTKEVEKEILEKVSKQLGNEPATVKGHYVDPKFFDAVFVLMGLKEKEQMAA